MLPQQPQSRHQHGQQTDLTELQLKRLQAQRRQAEDRRLLDQVESHISKTEHFKTSAELIDLILRRYPDCPRFASMMVDRLMAGDEALAAALQQEVL